MGTCRITKILLIVVFFGFLLRLGAIYFIDTRTTDKVLFVDEISYDRRGWIIARTWHSGESLNNKAIIYDSVASQKYHYLVASIYYIFGHNPNLVKIVNALFGCGLTFLIYHIAKRIWDEKVAFFSALFVCLYPTLVLSSVLNLKDISLIFFGCLAMLLAIILHERFRWHILLLLIVSFWILHSCRDIVAFFLSVSVILSFLKIPVLRKKGLSLKSMLPGIIFFILVIGVLYAYREYFKMDILSNVNLSRNNLVKGNMAFYPNIDTSSPLKALQFLPVGLSYFLLGPFPWTLNTFVQRLILPELILWYTSIGFAFYGIWFSFKNLRFKRRKMLIPVLFILFLSIGYALFDGNIGTMYRHRTQIVPYYIMFFSVGLLRVLKRFIKDLPGSTDKKDRARRFKRFLEMLVLDKKTTRL